MRPSVRILSSEEDSTRCEVILEKVVEVEVKTKVQLEKIGHDFLGGDHLDFPFLPPLMNHRIEAVRQVQ